MIRSKKNKIYKLLLVKFSRKTFILTNFNERRFGRISSILNSMKEKYPENILRIRRCVSFGSDDNPRRKCNFNCPACSDTVVMILD